MKQIILNLAMDLGGFIEGKNKEVGWIIFDEESELEIQKVGKD